MQTAVEEEAGFWMYSSLQDFRGYWCRGCHEWKSKEDFDMEDNPTGNYLIGRCRRCGIRRVNPLD